MNDGWRNPISMYLGKNWKCKVLLTLRSIHVSSLDGELLEVMPMPPVVKNWIEAFDRGLYPNKVTKGDSESGTSGEDSGRPPTERPAYTVSNQSELHRLRLERVGKTRMEIGVLLDEKKGRKVDSM
jgi:hypothetical protein